MSELRTKPCTPEVLISSDMMSAKLKLHLIKMGQCFNVEELKEWLRQSKVKAGVMEEVISEMIEHGIYDIYTEVAVGKVPEKGKDGYFVFHVSNPDNSSGPRLLEDGSVEYVRVVEFAMVEENQLLAEYVPATFGIYGYTVGNEMRMPQKGKELSPLRGRGFRVEDGKYYANKAGKVEVTDASINISDVLIIKCDVDRNYGHVNYDGDVVIKGDVRSGMLLKATGNIEIKGHVGNCFINAGKNITIQQGMQGKFSGKLQAGGDIYCKFFENTSAEAIGNIVVRTSMGSKLQAEGKVIVEGKDSVVIGGSIRAIQGIEIAEAGNEVEVNTLLAAGVLSKTLQRNEEVRKLIAETEKYLTLASETVRKFEGIAPGTLSKEGEEKRLQIIQSKVIKSTELKQLKDEKVRIEALIESGKDATVVVNKVIYPGCKIEIAGMPLLIKEKAKHVKFVVRDGKVEATLLY